MLIAIHSGSLRENSCEFQPA